MIEVNDPTLLAQLNSREVTDPEVLKQLNNEDSAVVQTIKNVPRSAANFAGSIANAVLHPIDTATGLGKLASGAVQNAPIVPSLPALGIAGSVLRQLRPEDREVANAVGGFYKDRYGSLENTKRSIIEDPIGVLSDASLILTGGGAALKAVGLNKAAQVTKTAAKFSDPLYLAGKAIKTVGKPIYRHIAGQTTGAGARVIDEALKGSDEFTDAMRGNTSETDVVAKGKDALQEVKQARGDAYRAKLEEVEKITGELNIDDIKSLADEQLKRFKVNNVDGELDFSRSAASSSAKEIEEVYKMVKDWGSKPGDLTPAMLDILKRRLDDFYTEGRASGAMVTTLKKAIQAKIVQAVPEYAEMTKGYAKSTEAINEIEKALGLGTRTGADTALRKLMMALKEDKNLRSDLINKMDPTLSGSVAGAVMRPVSTRALGSVATGVGVGLTGLATTNPWLLALLPMASPRVVGEFSRYMGKIGRNAEKARIPAQLSYQAGRLPQQ